MSASTCSTCGRTLSPADRFCAVCGTAVAGSRVADSQEITGTIYALGTNPVDSGPLPSVGSGPELEPGTALLMIVRGPAAGSTVELTGENMTAGRAPETDIFLDDITVSRQHAQFEFDRTAWKLVDLGSLNGTYVNRQRVDSAELANGDEIQIGKYRFRFVSGAAATGG